MAVGNKLFSVKLEGFLRDARYKSFVLKLSGREKIAQLFHEVLEAEAEAIRELILNADAVGSLEAEYYNSIKVINGNVDFLGNYSASIISTSEHAEVLERPNRSTGPAPFNKIMEWAMFKFDLTEREAYPVTKGLMQKLMQVGFDGNKAPHRIFEFHKRKLDRSQFTYKAESKMNEIGLYIASRLNS